MNSRHEAAPSIPKDEFVRRIESIRQEMDRNDLDAILVYGDEYRKENLRYVSNFWPIFERGAVLIPKGGEPIYAGAPEGEVYVRESCCWNDVRNAKEFMCVSVTDEIDYPLAKVFGLGDLVAEAVGAGNRLGVIGISDMPVMIFDGLKSRKADLVVTDASGILDAMRAVKSPAELACLREAGRLACVAYERLMEKCVPGNTELEAVGAAEGAARMAGAEAVTFSVFGSGERTNTIIGRPTRKMLEDGDMIMAAIAVQYEGYVATAEFPFVAGRAHPEQADFMSSLVEAANVAVRYMKPGVPMKEMVTAVRDYFRSKTLDPYDVYPPMHGIGLAEAESPYPDENTGEKFVPGMAFNTDISLFGIPGIGGNRIEEGLILTDSGVESITPLITRLRERHA